jgi:hypothetical protein
LTPSFQISQDAVAFWRGFANNVLVRATSQVIAPGLNLNLGGIANRVPLRLVGTQLTTNGFVQMDNPLPNYTDYYASLTLTWSLSVDNGDNWFSPSFANTSSNQTFVTLADPVGSLLPGIAGWPATLQALPSAVMLPVIKQTVFYAGIWGSIGSTNQTDLVTNVFAGFQSRTITRADGVPMTYYGSWNNRNYTTASLIQDHDGMCTAWARFFIDVLRAQGGDFSSGGAQTNLIQILPADGNKTPLILVKKWIIPAQGNIVANAVNRQTLLWGYTNYNNGSFNVQQVNGVWQYVWQDGANANVQQDLTGIAGQNNLNPPSAFVDHWIVQIGNTLYDPSYGVTYELGPANNPLVNFATAAIAGYARPQTIMGLNFVAFQGPGDPATTSTRLVMRPVT